VVGKLLGEVERQGESSLLLILLFLLDKSVGFGSERLNGRGRASESNVGSHLGNPDRDLISLSAFLLLLDESSKAFVELSRDIKSSTGDSFLLVDQVKNVLLGILKSLLKGSDLSIRWLCARQLVRTVGGVRALEDQENRNVAL
jgi:hypothetical protein